MVEDDSGLEGPKGGISDNLISFKVKALEKPAKPGHFSERKNPNPEGEGWVKEKDLPVVKEAIDTLKVAKETGRLVSKAENPLGTISSFKMDVISDVHVTGSYPEESVESRSPVLRGLQELGPRSLKTKLERVTKVNGYEATGKNWSDEVRPSMSIQSFRVLSETLVNDIKASQEFFGPGSAVAIIDIGDKSNTEAVEGDIAMNAIEWEKLRKKAELSARDISHAAPEETTLEKFQRERRENLQALKGEETIVDSGPKVIMACPEGNHDSDLNNKGLDNEAIKRELYGSQIFFQEVGDEHIVLAINTNFESSFWWKNFQEQKEKATTEEDKEIIRGIEEEIELQKEIVKKAKDSGRKIVVLAHEAELVDQAVGLEDSRVTHIISGHLHASKNEPMKDRNSDGQNVKLVRAGSTFIGMSGWEKVKDPIGFSITIKKNAEGEEKVEVAEIQIPDNVKSSVAVDY